jgi:hypothetical protein
MSASDNRRFGFAWLGFAAVLVLHVTDEGAHDFLSVYNPTAQSIRARLLWLPLPTFIFRAWLFGLAAGILLLVLPSPFAFRGAHWMQMVAVPLAVVFGIFNAFGHMLGSAYYQRWMPGVYSAPVLLGAAIWLLANTRRRASSASAARA